jgi:hypothetical protein
MTAIDIRSQYDRAVLAFKAADVDCQLAMLWQIHATLGQAFASVAPVALYSQSVQHLLKQLEQVNRDERLHILRDILAGEYTRFTEEYRALNINMRMAFWHRVASKMSLDSLPTAAVCNRTSGPGRELLHYVDSMGLNERLHYLRRVLS